VKEVEVKVENEMIKMKKIYALNKQIGDQNTEVIAEELKKSINVDSLKLVNDEIGDIGIKKIVESLTET